MHAAFVASERSDMRAGNNGAILANHAELSPRDVLVLVGSLIRTLHDTLQESGSNSGGEEALGPPPDVRASLDYIADLPGKTSGRLLGATERAKALQSEMGKAMGVLGGKWDALLAGSPGPRALWELGRETQEWLVESQLQQARIDRELTEAFLAQDFHDLTGQVVQCIARLARVMEDQFVKMPLDAGPSAQRHE